MSSSVDRAAKKARIAALRRRSRERRRRLLERGIQDNARSIENIAEIRRLLAEAQAAANGS